MASTYDSTGIQECMPQRVIVDGVDTGKLLWKTTEPGGWAASDKLATWDELNAQVQLDSSPPTGGKCPRKMDFVPHVVEPLSAPTETPGTPVLSTGGGGLQADWTNTTSAWQVRVVYECASDFSFNGSFLIAAGSTTHQYNPSNPTLRAFVCRVRYENAAGNGPFSADSNSHFA